MTLSNIANIRLLSQQIVGTKFKSPKDIVSWMGAMQAQDYAMAKWAVGVRLPGSTEKEIETAVDNGQIIRTHVLRPTWHLVPAEDIYWMLELTAPHIKSAYNSNNKRLELDESIFSKCNKIIEKTLSGGNHFTREELVTEIKKAKIPIDTPRAIHIMLHAELDGVICSGVKKGKKQTCALLAERVPKVKTLPREEALAKLAKKYFTSHCPATLKDFIWWSGLPVKDARQGLEMIKSGFVSETIDSETYWFPNSFSLPKSFNPSVYLLPAFDEFTISYRNRRASVPEEHHTKAISSNGIFRPIIVVDGKVTGLWRRIPKKDKIIIETAYFHPHDKLTKSLLEKAVVDFGKFLDKKTEVSHNVG